MIPPWRHARGRPFLIQLAVAGLLLAMGVWLVTTVSANLEARGIETGFRFLGQRAGFQISQSLVVFSEGHTFASAFLVGLLNTLLVSVLAIFLATVIGVAVGAGRLAPSAVVSRVCAGYVDLVRNIPPIIQLFFWYFVALRALPPVRESWSILDVMFINNRGVRVAWPILEAGFAFVVLATAIAIASFGWIYRRTGSWGLAWLTLIVLPAMAFTIAGMPLELDRPELAGFNFRGGAGLSPELVALVLTLSIYQAAYVAETVRSGLLAVPTSQSEAAQSLGLDRLVTFRFVVFPQALRISLPPLTNTYVNTIKASTIAAAIAYPDLASVFAGTVLNLTGQAIEIMLITGGVYVCICLVASGLINLYERRLEKRGR